MFFLTGGVNFVDPPRIGPGSQDLPLPDEVPQFQLQILRAGVKLVNVPFKSSGEAITALLGGHIEACILSGASGHLDAGTVRILAMAEPERVAGLDDIPTFKEFGYPIVVPTAYAFAFPKGTPKEVVDRFADAQNKAIQKYGKEITEGLRKVEQWASFRTAEDTVKTYQEGYKVFYKIAQELNVVAK